MNFPRTFLRMGVLAVGLVSVAALAAFANCK